MLNICTQKCVRLLALCVITAASVHTLVAGVIISNPFNFRDNTGPNTLGLPTGDVQQVGAFVSPSGPPTIVTAKQGTTVLMLMATPETIFPDDYEIVFPFDPSLTGAWQITATRGSDSTSVMTNPIGNPQVLPLVNNLHIVGTGLMPAMVWQWPAFDGLTIDAVGLRIINAVTGDQFFSKWPSPIEAGDTGTTASFDVPGGVLQFGQSYVFRVDLFQLDPDGSTMNRSSTFTQTPFTPIPEPGFAIPVALALIILVRRCVSTPRLFSAESDSYVR